MFFIWLIHYIHPSWLIATLYISKPWVKEVGSSNEEKGRIWATKTFFLKTPLFDRVCIEWELVADEIGSMTTFSIKGCCKTVVGRVKGSVNIGLWGIGTEGVGSWEEEAGEKQEFDGETETSKVEVVDESLQGGIKTVGVLDKEDRV